MKIATAEDYKKHVRYEWVLETLDEHGDIQDVTHYDTLLELFSQPKPNRADVGLVRSEGSEANGIENRQWAYLEDGKLPNKFDGGAAIPERFRNEVSRTTARLMTAAVPKPKAGPKETR